MYDIIIKSGTIVDGTGKDSYVADVAIKDGKIIKIGDCESCAEKVIDATGLVVTPGFIDSHSHSDGRIVSNPDQTQKTEQGITTAVGGQCGGSAAPYIRDGKIYTVSEFFADVENIPQGTNITMFVGHGSLRKAVIGFDNRKPTDSELEKMKELLRDGLEHGATGLSFGLIYTPGCFAETEELIELAKVAAEYNRPVAAHIRNESETLIEAVEEFITVIRESGARGVVSHHKAAYRKNWGKVKTTIAMIENANASGMDIHMDVYPYIASNTSLAARFIPKEYLSGGTDKLMEHLGNEATRAEIKEKNRILFGDCVTDFSWVLVVGCDAYPEYVGLNLEQIASIHRKDVYDSVFDILVANKNQNCQAMYFSMCEEDVETVISHPLTMIGTDAFTYKEKAMFHPRTVGTFPRAIGKYVRERGVTTLQEMIRKMTSVPASVYGLENKGLIKEGYDADICIFDFEKIIDKASPECCDARAEGLNYVLVGGKIAAENAVFNGTRAGKLIFIK